MGPRVVLIGMLAWTALLYAPVTAAPFVYEDANWRGVPVTVSQVPTRALAHATLIATGTDAGAAHVVSLGLHLLNGVLVAAIGTAVIGAWPGVVAAGLFLVHPLATQAVSYLSARPDLLMTTGTLLAVLAAVSGWASRWRIAGVLGGCLLAALSKEIGLIAFPLVLLTLAIRRDRGPVWGVTWIAACLCAAAGASVAASWFWHPPAWTAAVSWDEFLRTQNAAIWRLLTLTIWPVGLSIDHDMRAIALNVQQGALGLSLLAGTLVVVLWRRAPLVAWGIAWVAITVAPRFVFRTGEFVAEHQMYLGLVGLAVAAGAMVTPRKDAVA